MNRFIEQIAFFFKMNDVKTEKEIGKILTKNSMTISTAESCTGGLISSRLTDIAGSSAYIKENYGIFNFDCNDYERLYEFMLHDKKNTAGIINFTLLGGIGDIRINQTANKKEIFEVLDFYRES